ncbi:MAG: RagB/SusD family nutrient uptake outer membrane protein [Prevotellaceae bacterium]|jgi:hypothetical protein|nr:RagB/SusD family nutrient uptake outer membrane protein [Prevotellaceae bacterium]
MNRLFLIFCLPALLAASCNDSFLERSPEDKVSDGAVWKTPEHLRLYANNFYNRIDLLPSYADYGNMGIFTLDRDNGSDTQVGINHNARLNGEGIVPTSGGGWAIDDWAALRDVNYFLASCGKASGNQAEINRYVGEALFFRAIFYFNKLRRFGDLPIYKTLLDIDDTEDLYRGRSSRGKVVEWMLSDLDSAVAYLPSRTDAGWRGRVNRETAMLLQARIALYEGTWEKYHALANTPFKVGGASGTPFIEKAVDVTDKLMGMGTCGLDNVGVPNGYWLLFNRESYANSREVLFWRQYADNVLTHYWADYSSNGGGTGLTKSMVDSYLCIDGKPIDVSSLYTVGQSDSTLLSVVENRDPRLRQTIYVNDGLHFRFTEPNDTFFYPVFTGANEKKCVTGYQLYKGHNPNRERASKQTGITGLIYFRYAEALLINAEAKAELDDVGRRPITQSDLDATINLLRGRVGMPHLRLAEVGAWGSYAKEFPLLSGIVNEVRRERKVELAAEGFRTDDLFRWAAAEHLIYRQRPRGAKRAQWERLPANVAGSILSIPVDRDGYIDPYANVLGSGVRSGYRFNRERDYLYPIPRTELVLNPKLRQNPGW